MTDTPGQLAGARLVLLTDDEAQDYQISDELVVGSGPDCGLQIEDAHLLGAHFKIVREEDGFHLCAFKGAKVKLNGQLESYAELSPGDDLAVGPFEFLFEESAAVAAPSSWKGPLIAAAAILPVLLLLGGAVSWLVWSRFVAEPEPVEVAQAPVVVLPESPVSVAAEDPIEEDPDALIVPDLPEVEESPPAPSEPVTPPVPAAPPEKASASEAPKAAAPAVPAGVDLAALRLSYTALLKAKKFDEAKALVSGALTKATEAQKATLESWLLAIDAAFARHEEALWVARKKLIAKQWKAREEWNTLGQELRELAGYLDHDQWSFRAIGAVGLVSGKDPRGIGKVGPAVADKSSLVRAFALKALTRLPAQDLKRCEGGVELVEKIIKEMGKSKRITRLSRVLLAGLAGEDLKTRLKWQRWLKEHRDDFVPALTPPFDLSSFSAEELERYESELQEEQRAGMRTVLRGEKFKSALEELRKNGLEVAICLDVTGSMGGVLKESQKKIESLSMILSNLVGNFRIGLVTYRDAVAATVPLTKNWSVFKKALDQQRATGGGDGPEGVEKGVEAALAKMGWRKKATRSIVVIGDAPPHPEDMKRFEEIARAAKKYGIVIHGLYPRAVVRDIDKAVKIAGGQSATLASDTEFMKSFLLLIFGKELEPYLTAFLDIYMEIAEELKQG